MDGKLLRALRTRFVRPELLAPRRLFPLPVSSCCLYLELTRVAAKQVKNLGLHSSRLLKQSTQVPGGCSLVVFRLCSQAPGSQGAALGPEDGGRHMRSSSPHGRPGSRFSVLFSARFCMRAREGCVTTRTGTLLVLDSLAPLWG